MSILEFGKKIVPKPVFNFFQPAYHLLMALAGNVVYGFPSSKIFVLGITGTKGKSTTLELINSILETAGKRTALLSSIRIKIGKESKKNYLGNTMPGRFFIQKFLRKAVNAGCQYALIEATSQGIIQYRHCFIGWNAAIFTNLAPEHIEAHGSFEKYREAKLRFFTYIKKLIGKKLFFINQDDANARHFIEAAQSGKVILYSKNDILNTLYLIPNTLIGDFNKENIAAAIAFAKSQNIKEYIIKKTIKNFQGVPGRMEIVAEKPFRIIIDYAHTPDSLEAAYKALSSHKLICVLGSAGGGRDKWKRPEMGKIAAKHCRKIVLTNEDPYNENPFDILRQIEIGIRINSRTLTRKSDFIYKVLDRKEAIKKAVSLAKKGDKVIITGKGCEPFIHVAGDKKIPWNERKIVEETIK